MDADYMFPSVREIRLEKQNQRLRADLRDAVEIIESVADDIAKDYYHTDEQVLCGFCHREEHSPHCIVRIAKEFISRPSVKAVMERKG